MDAINFTPTRRPPPGPSEPPRGPGAIGAGPAVVPTTQASGALAPRQGSPVAESRHAGVPAFVVKDIESTADALRALEKQAAAPARGASRAAAAVAVPTPAERAGLQKDVARLEDEVHASRKGLGTLARNVEELEQQIRGIEAELHKASQPAVAAANVLAVPFVDAAALRDRRTAAQNDIRQCSAKVEELATRHRQATSDAEIRDAFLQPPSRKTETHAVRSWLDTLPPPTPPRAQRGRRATRDEGQPEHRIRQFFGVSAASGSQAPRATDDALKGNLPHLLGAFAGEASASMRELVAMSVARLIAAKSHPRPGLVEALSARTSASREILGGMLLKGSAAKAGGGELLASLLVDKNMVKVLNDAVEQKVPEFRALLAPPAASPAELLELKQAWETRLAAQRAVVESINAELARPVPAAAGAAPAARTGEAVQARLRADLDRVMDAGARRTDDYAQALAEHTRRASALETARARWDEGLTQLAEARGSKQRRSAENAEEGRRAAQALHAEMDTLWDKVQPSLARAFTPEALARTVDRHLGLSGEALEARLDVNLTRATTYASRSDLLTAVADVLQAADQGKAASGAERVVSHDRQIGHGKRLTRTGPTQETVAHATSFRLEQDARIAHMMPWIPSVAASR
jgi:predicted  nucleic acid-binding Zn-ribbon protein